MSEWISSLVAVQRLRAAGLAEPQVTLGQWAEARQLRTRARWGRFSDWEEEREFPTEPPTDEIKLSVSGPWPAIPSDFWRWVNADGDGAQAHYEAGTFAATVVYEPELGSYSDTQHIKLFDVTFNCDDLNNLLSGGGGVHESERLRPVRGRKPDTSRRDTFAAILAVELYKAGKDNVPPSQLKKSKLQNMVEAVAVEKANVPSRKTMDNLLDQTVERLNEQIAQK